MKHLITCLLFVVHAAAAQAADTVVVHSATRVTVNGTDYGKPADAIANNKQLASAIQLALENWAANETFLRTEAESDLIELKQRISSVLQTMLAEELKTGEGPRTAILRKLIAESGKTDSELKRAALAAEIAAKQKELDGMKP